MRLGAIAIGMALAAAAPVPTAKPPPDPNYNRACKVVLVQRDPYPAPASPWWMCADKTGDTLMLGPSSKPAPGQPAAAPAAKVPAAKAPAAKPAARPPATPVPPRGAARTPLDKSARFRAARECWSLLRAYQDDGTIKQMKPQLQKFIIEADLLTMLDLGELGQAMGYTGDEVDSDIQAYHRSETARALYRQDRASFRGGETRMLELCLDEAA